MLQRLYPAGYVFLNLAATAPNAVGTVYVYENETTTPVTIYSDLSGTESDNPLTLGADGRLPNDVYVNGVVRVKLLEYNATPASGTQVFQKDNQPARPESFFVSDYGAVLDGSTDDLAAFSDAVTAAANSTLIIDGPIKLSDNVTVPATVYVIARGTITMAAGKYFVAMKILHEKEKWISGFNNVYDLRAFGSYPGLGSGVSQTAPWNVMIAALGNGDTILLGTGIRYFNTKPNVMTAPPHMIGAGLSGTQFIRNYVEAGGDTVGFFTFQGNGCNGLRLSDFTLYANTNSTGGTMLKFVTNSNEPAGFNSVRNVLVSYVDATAQYAYGLLVDGSANHSASPGWRDMIFEHFDTYISVGGTAAARFDTALGVLGSMTVPGKLIGTGSVGYPSHFDLTISSIAEVSMDWAGGSMYGSCNYVTLSANATRFTFMGETAAASSTDLGTANRIISERTRFASSATIASGGTSVAALHGCGPFTPTAGQITLTLAANPTNDIGLMWVDTITDTQFNINCRSAPGGGAGVDVGYSVDVSRNAT